MNDKGIILRVNGMDIKGSDMFSAVDDVLNQVRKTSNLALAENAIVALMTMEKLSGMALAKLLSGLHVWWRDTGQDDLTNDTFEDWIYSVSTQFSPIYLSRCVTVWEKTEAGVFSERIQERPLKDQQAIASHLDQGYELSEDEWEELEDAVDNGEVLAILRESKGKPPRKQSLDIKQKRDGSIQLFYQGEFFHAGYHVPLDKADSPKHREALEKFETRFLKGTGGRKE